MKRMRVRVGVGMGRSISQCAPSILFPRLGQLNERIRLSFVLAEHEELVLKAFYFIGVI